MDSAAYTAPPSSHSRHPRAFCPHSYFSRGRISFGIYRRKKQHCRKRKKIRIGIRGKSSAAAVFFAGAVARGIRFRGGAAYQFIARRGVRKSAYFSQIGNSSAYFSQICQQRGRRKPPVQRPRESDFRQFGEFAPVTPFSAISAAVAGG